MEEKLRLIGLIASVVLPLWNIPLIYRIVQLKSSREISLAWAFGVWGCLGVMLPSGIISKDYVWKIFTIVNFVLFTGVVATVLAFRGTKADPPSSSTK